MSLPDVDVAVIGGGVVGLSIAHLAAARGRSVVRLETHPRLGEETSTHNSMVLHAGIYYPPGSLKARLCVEGRAEMVARCRAWRVEHSRCGKLIVAANDFEVADLERLRANAEASGQTACRVVARDEMRRAEPAVRGVAALWSPETAVFDVPGYLQSLAARAQGAGATLLASAKVVALEPAGESIAVVTDARGSVRAAAVVNAGGLWADEVARLAGNDRYRVHPCRGEYAAVVPRRAGIVRGLVYPVPREGASLGVHLTRTIFGELWIGPTVKYVARRDDYETDRLPLSVFHERATRLVEGLARDDLRLGPSGIRPKRVPEGSPAADFLIERDPSVQNLVHLIGIESPGLTASPAIAAEVLNLVFG